MGLVFRNANHRDGMYVKSHILTGKAESSMRVLVRGIYARLGTWDKTAEAIGTNTDCAWKMGNPGHPIHADKVDMVKKAFASVKHLPRLEKPCTDKSPIPKSN